MNSGFIYLFKSNFHFDLQQAATERKKRADEYDALDLMQKVTDGLGLAVNEIPHRPSPNNIFVFSSSGDPNKAGELLHHNRWNIEFVS